MRLQEKLLESWQHPNNLTFFLCGRFHSFIERFSGYANYSTDLGF